MNHLPFERSTPKASRLGARTVVRIIILAPCPLSRGVLDKSTEVVGWCHPKASFAVCSPSPFLRGVGLCRGAGFLSLPAVGRGESATQSCSRRPFSFPLVFGPHGRLALRVLSSPSPGIVVLLCRCISWSACPQSSLLLCRPHLCVPVVNEGSPGSRLSGVQSLVGGGNKRGIIVVCLS